MSQCRKSGIKIHETPSSDQEAFYNKIKNENRHTGVRVVDNNNSYLKDPFENFNPFSDPDLKSLEQKPIDASLLKNIDLNINNYSMEDIYALFGISKISFLSDEIMKNAKKIVLKTHPDKSKLESKYFLFFTAAYKKLHSVYEFQNKSTNKKIEHDKDIDNTFNKTHKTALDSLFTENKDLYKNKGEFNKWFNEQFDKYKVEDESAANGYGDWLKSNEGVQNLENITQANMNAEMEKIKKNIQGMVKYEGVSTPTFNYGSGGVLLNNSNNFTFLGDSNSLGYTDLKQAYEESVIPITQDDYNNVKKFKNVEDYLSYRNQVDTTPLSQKDAMKELYNINKKTDTESVALAYHFAKQQEKVQQKNQEFWSNIKQIKN
jgi:hypothetical protein